MKYKLESSAGFIMELNNSPRFYTTEGNFHFGKYEPDIDKKVDFGEKVLKFKKKPLKIEIITQIRGADKECKRIADALVDYFEADVRNKKVSHLCADDWKVECYVTEWEFRTSEINPNWMELELEIYCPYPFWTKSHFFSFLPTTTSSTGNKKYPNRFPYRYANGYTEYRAGNPSQVPSNFILRIYGPTVNPLVQIGGQDYQFFASIGTGEYLEMKTKDLTIYKIGELGERINYFHSRAKKTDFFKLFPVGQVKINSSGTFEYDIDILEERSEPRWTV